MSFAGTTIPEQIVELDPSGWPYPDLLSNDDVFQEFSLTPVIEVIIDRWNGISFRISITYILIIGLRFIDFGDKGLVGNWRADVSLFDLARR